MNDLNDIGTRIKQLREEKKLTQAELANLIGCGQATIAAWEKNRGRFPHRRYLKSLSQLFKVELDFLLGKNGIDQQKTNYLGEVQSEMFFWEQKYNLRNKEENFTLKINDNFLEPVANKGDICTFEKKKPKNGDIVIVRFPKDKSIIRMWRQKNNFAMLSEINVEKIAEPFMFEILSCNESTLEYVVNKDQKREIFFVEGKLIMVKKNPRNIATYSGVVYSI